jgi:transient receptor potential cation channel subfamily M protein 3
VLVKMEKKPSWPELYAIIYICTLACEEVREIVSSKPANIRYNTLLFLLSCSQF